MSPEREHRESLRIEAYLAGKMNPNQCSAFEAECETDAALQDLLEQYLVSRHIVQRSGIPNQKEQWNDLRAEMLSSRSKSLSLRTIWPYLAAAMIFLLLIWGGLMLFDISPANSDQLFAEYYKRPLAPELMGNTVMEAERYYRQGDFSKAIASYEALAQDSSQSIELNSYMFWGIAYLEVGDIDNALARFAELKTLPEQRDWYTALIYLKADEKEKGMKLLNQIVADEQHFYRREALDLMEKWAK